MRSASLEIAASHARGTPRGHALRLAARTAMSSSGTLARIGCASFSRFQCFKGVGLFGTCMHALHRAVAWAHQHEAISCTYCSALFDHLHASQRSCLVGSHAYFKTMRPNETDPRKPSCEGSRKKRAVPKSMTAFQTLNPCCSAPGHSCWSSMLWRCMSRWRSGPFTPGSKGTLSENAMVSFGTALIFLSALVRAFKDQSRTPSISAGTRAGTSRSMCLVRRVRGECRGW